MTQTTLFGDHGTETSPLAEPRAKAVRLKSIKAVFQNETVCDAPGIYRLGAKTTQPAEVAILFGHLQEETKEHLIALHLDSKNRIVCFDRVAVGSMSSAIAHPREVFKSALLSSAAAILLVHNHPSGDPAPSQDDIRITQRLRDCGDLLGIPVIDHIIIGDDKYYSFAESRLIH